MLLRNVCAHKSCYGVWYPENHRTLFDEGYCAAVIEVAIFWKNCTFSENPNGSLSTFFHQINSLWGKKIICCDINDIVRDLE